MDNKKAPQFVIDLKKKQEETNSNVKATEPSSRVSALFTLRKKLFTKKEKEINFLDSTILANSGLGLKKTRTKFSIFKTKDQTGEDEIDMTYYQNNSVKKPSRVWFGLAIVWLPFKLLSKIASTFIFLLRFFWLLSTRLLGLFTRQLRRLGRPKFGNNPNRLTVAMFISKLLSFPFRFGKNIKNIISSPEARRESRQQQSLLFAEFSRKTHSALKQALAFTVLLVMLVLPFKAFSYYQIIKNDDLKGKVLGATSEAISSLKSAQSSIGDLEMMNASLDFSRAGNSFRAAKQEVEELEGVILKLAKIFPQQDIRLAGLSKEILTIGELSSELGINLSLAFNGLIKEGENQNMTDVFDKFFQYEGRALDNIRAINNILKDIKLSALPSEYQADFGLLKEKTGDLEDILSEIDNLGSGLRIFLGLDYDKRYLFVFQNNNEARATGGFIGSFALVDFSRAKIKNIEVPGGGSYDTEGGLYTEVVAPAPLHLVNPMWHFWDANWWPDWEKSARKLIWFYEKSGGPTVDGVISLTPTVLEKLLEITGPIDMTETHGVVMTADNFWLNIRNIIEEEKNSDLSLPSELIDNKPKKIIGEFFQKLMLALPNHLNRESIVQFLAAAESSLEEKQALFYFKDSALQEQVASRNWAGKVKDTNKDYLMVVNTNIAGGKSDKAILQEINHEVEIADDGSVIDTLKIKRSHTASNGEPFYGVRNVNWMRIYVPEGSELLEASGFRGPDPVYFEEADDDWLADKDVLSEEAQAVIDQENQNTFIYQESGKTVFANWSMIDPGQDGLITIKYKLPFKLEKEEMEQVRQSRLTEIFNKIMQIEKKELYVYSLLLQKQAGQRFTTFNSQLAIADNFEPVWKYPPDLMSDSSGWDFSTDFNKDEYLAFILTAK